MNSQLKRGTLELCVLSILCRSDCYGYELVNRISECMQITIHARWMRPGHGNGRVFSAAAFYFAREVAQATGVTVGIVHSS